MTSRNMGDGYKTVLHNGKKAISHNRSISGYQTAAKTGTLTTWGGLVMTYGTVEARRDGLAYICHKIRTIAQAHS